MTKLDHLTFSYSDKALRPAVDDASAVIPEGIVLLLGENGAGKTTLLRLMAGWLIPQSGCVDIDGGNPASRLPSVLSNLYYMPDDATLPCRDIRRYAAASSEFYPRWDAELFESNLKDFGLTGSEKFDALSLGNRHKTLLAFALASGVDLLLLDEPANGLDITSKNTLRHMLARNVDVGQTVVISTHTVGDLRELYDGLVVMSKGSVLVSLPMSEIASRLSCPVTEIPPLDAIYFEQRAGRFHSICPVAAGEEPVADPDFTLLYSALLSPRRNEILKLLKQ